MEVVSIWEGGSLPAVGFVNETERKHHLGWKVSAGLFLPAWTVWMPESKAVWGRPGGGGLGCVDQDPSMLVAFLWEDRGEGETRETQREGREGRRTGREKGGQQRQRTKEETQERETGPRGGSVRRAKGRDGGYALRWARGPQDPSVPGLHSKPLAAL